jgi:hypothetical protein
MKQFMIIRLEQGKEMLVFSFHEKTPVGPQKILDLMKKAQNNIRFSPDARLFVPLAGEASHSPGAIFHTANEIIDFLQPELT